MQSKARTIEEYLAGLPADRREAVEALRAVILKNLGAGFEEGMQYGMIGYFVPHSVYPAGYHCDPRQPLPFAGLASQKHHMSLYLFCIYQDESLHAWFAEAWQAEAAKGRAGRLDMGKGCVRFKKLGDVPLEVVGKAMKKVTLKKFIGQYEALRSAHGQSRTPAQKTAKKLPAEKASRRAGTKRDAAPASKKTAKKAPTKAVRE